MSERMVLQRALAEAGVASRRGAEQFITKGRVRVNNTVVTKLGTRVDPSVDVITVDGKPLSKPEHKVYFLLHKPKGVLTTARDDHDRKTVVDLVKTKERIVPVGRLDYNTTGLLLLTNDGDMVYKLTHPKYEHEKEYEALIEVPKKWTPREVQGMATRLRKGVPIEEGVVSRPARVTVRDIGTPGKKVLTIAIHEGRKHQIRRMISAVSGNVVSLRRIRMGSLTLGDLKEGEYRALTDEEITGLKKHIA